MNLCEIDAIIRRFFYVEKNSLFGELCIIKFIYWVSCMRIVLS